MSKGLADDRLTAAHRGLREAGDVQFDLPPVDAPSQPPTWLRELGEWVQWALAPIGRFLSWISSMMPAAPYARIVLWTMIVVLAVLVVWTVVNRVRDGVWRLPKWQRAGAATPLPEYDGQADWTPDAAPAQRWLDQADRLAAEGRFAEAVHHILLRSVEDIARRRPQLLRPALTSRDIARSTSIPAAPRQLFAQLASVVERSLFGGTALDADDWQHCRASYAEFALAKAWRG